MRRVPRTNRSRRKRRRGVLQHSLAGVRRSGRKRRASDAGSNGSLCRSTSDRRRAAHRRRSSDALRGVRSRGERSTRLQKRDRTVTRSRVPACDSSLACAKSVAKLARFVGRTVSKISGAGVRRRSAGVAVAGVHCVARMAKTRTTRTTDCEYAAGASVATKCAGAN